MAGRANFLPYQIGADGKPQLALPGILAGAVNAVTAPYRAMNPQDYPDFNTEQEAADFALNMMGGGTVFGSAPKNALGMNVWHGSPHKFEPTELNDLGEFNAAKIGTGEGAQAYSHGHYTGEARGTGEVYRNQLSPTQYVIGEKSFHNSSDAANALAGVDANFQVKYPVELALTQMKIKGANLDDSIKFMRDQYEHFDPRNLDRAETLLRQSGAGINSSGYLYKVDIPDEHIAQMLDWDKPLSEQNKKVRDYFESFAAPKRINMEKQRLNPLAAEGSANMTYNPIGGRLLQRYGEDNSLNPENLAKELQQAGIPGVRYLDKASRGATGDTSNFVVFPGNERMMTILERNGQAMSPESQAIARYREIKGPKSVVRMEAALRTAGVPLPKNEPVAYIQGLVDRAHRRN